MPKNLIKTLLGWVRPPPLIKKIWVFSDKDFLDWQRPPPFWPKVKKIVFWLGLEWGCFVSGGVLKSKGRHQQKKTGIFLLSVKREAGGSRPIQKILIRKYSNFFWLRGGGLTQSKKSSSENTQIFFTKGGILPNPKGFYQKNWDFLA